MTPLVRRLFGRGTKPPARILMHSYQQSTRRNNTSRLEQNIGEWVSESPSIASFHSRRDVEPDVEDTGNITRPDNSYGGHYESQHV